VIKLVENYADFKTLAYAVKQGLQEVIVKNIEGESISRKKLKSVAHNLNKDV